MTPFAVYAYLFGYICAAAYVLFGVLHVVAPQLTLRVYRVFLGQRLFARAAIRLTTMPRLGWKIFGVVYIAFGMLFTWSLMNSFQHMQQVAR